MHSKYCLQAESIFHERKGNGNDICRTKKGNLNTFKICNNLLGLRDEIKSRFEWMLIANCFQAAVMIITSSYYTIESIFDGYLAHVIWNSVDTAQFFFRVWLICYMADRLRQSVSNFTNSYFID